MFDTSLDILYLVLAGGLGLLLICLSILTIRVIGTVNRVNKITDIVEDSADTVNTYIQMPASLFASAISAFKQWKD